jgi:hypothetical protein
MNIKGNTRIEGEAVVESLPISASSLSTLVEVGGLLHKRQFSDIVLQPKEAYIPGLSVSFPSIFNLNTESLDYNNRSLVVSLKNQLAGTAFLAPVAMNGTPAFRRIVKSDLTDAGVAFIDDNYVKDVAITKSPNYGQRFTVSRKINVNTIFIGNTVIDTRSTQSGLGSDGSQFYLPNVNDIPNNTSFSLFHYLNDTWYSSLITKGWSTGYSAWKISGFASTSNNLQREFYLSHTLADGSWGKDYKIWHNGNLSNPATQDWVTSQGFSKTDTTYSKFTKTADGLVPAPTGTTSTRYLREDGNWVVPTNTTYSVITPAELDGGIATTGRLVSSKNLNDWVNTKIKPSVLEYTLQEGITNPLWSSNATGKYSIAIGSYSNSTGYNSLALLQGARAEGFSSLAIGEYSQALGSRSVAIGSYVTSINESYSFGFAVTNNQAGCVAIGEFNADIPFGDGMQRTNNSETPLFIIGNGISSMVRSNAHVLYRDGSTRNYGRQYYDETMRSTIDFTKDNTLADVKFVKENGGGGLPSDPFSSISSSGFSGDTIDNPKFIGSEPNNLDVIVLAIERGQGLNVWDKATVSGNKFSLFGIYLKTYKKVLLRGYYKNGSSGYINNSYLFNTNSKTLEWGWGGTAGVDYVLLGNMVDAQTGLILFNPR